MKRCSLAFIASLALVGQAWAQVSPFPGPPQVPPAATTGGTPGGSSGQIQYNNAGAFGGLTDTQLTTHIDAFTSAQKGAVPASGGGTANFLRADGLWAVPPGGGAGGSPGGSNLQVQYNNAGVFAGLTDAALTARIINFTGTLSGSVKASGGGTTNFLRADGNWVAPTISGGNTGVWNDQSAVIGSSSNFLANVSRFNNIFFGEQSTKTAGYQTSPTGNISWMDMLLPNVMVGAQVASTATLGTSAVTGAARTSDERAAYGGPSGGSAGAYFFGVGDDSPGTDGPIALGANLVGIHRAGSGITLGTQIDINSVVANGCQPSSDGAFCATGASTAGALITSGAFNNPQAGWPNLATQDIGAGIVLSADANSAKPKFKAGIIIDFSAIRADLGPTISGAPSTVAINLPIPGHILWGGTTASVYSAIGTDSGGNLVVFARNSIVINGTNAVSCSSGINNSTARVVKGIVTAC